MSQLLNIVIDVCQHNDPNELAKLVAASRSYWKGKDYQLISDEVGPDRMRVYKGSIVNDGGGDVYDKGLKDYEARDATVLVFQKPIDDD